MTKGKQEKEYKALIGQATYFLDRAEHYALVASKLAEALENICGNAMIIRDPKMKGYTDCYSVPLDDIETALDALKEYKGE